MFKMSSCNSNAGMESSAPLINAIVNNALFHSLADRAQLGEGRLTLFLHSVPLLLFIIIIILLFPSLFSCHIVPFPYALCQLEGMGSAVSSPSGSGRSPANIGF